MPLIADTPFMPQEFFSANLVETSGSIVIPSMTRQIEIIVVAAGASSGKGGPGTGGAGGASGGGSFKRVFLEAADWGTSLQWNVGSNPIKTGVSAQLLNEHVSVVGTCGGAPTGVFEETRSVVMGDGFGGDMAFPGLAGDSGEPLAAGGAGGVGGGSAIAGFYSQLPTYYYTNAGQGFAGIDLPGDTSGANGDIGIIFIRFD